MKITKETALLHSNYSKEYGNWLGSINWEFMITIRKNYRTTPNMVRNIATKLFNEINDIDKLTYVGERDGLDKSNYHIHILINTKEAMKAEYQLFKYSQRISKFDTFHLEVIKNKREAANYITKNFDWNMKIGDDIVWDILTK